MLRVESFMGCFVFLWLEILYLIWYLKWCYTADRLTCFHVNVQLSYLIYYAFILDFLTKFYALSKIFILIISSLARYIIIIIPVMVL